MKMTHEMFDVKCDICRDKRARYDGQTRQGPWGYMCETCWQKEGSEYGTILRWESDERPESRLETPSMEELEEMMLDGVVYARCEHGCEVEPDGYCPHGRPSWLIVMGMI